MQNQESSPKSYKLFVLPLSILLAGLMISSGILLAANRIVDRQEFITKDYMKKAVSEVLQGNVNDPVAGQQDDLVKVKTTLDDDPFQGNKDTAKIAIVEFSDYECPFCKMFFDQTYPQIKKDYIETGKVIHVFRDYPLAFHDPHATEQAVAGECIQDQSGDKKYFEFHDLVFKTTKSNKSIPRSQVYDLANQVGADSAKFKECFDNNKFAEEVKKDRDDGGKIGVDGTPGFVIGTFDQDGNVDGVLLTGAQPYDTFKVFIEQQLNK